MAKKFYEYAKLFDYPIINEVTSPSCPMGEDDPDVFLIYAENEEEAFNLAMEHIHDGKPKNKFYGIYKDEQYHGEVRCVM